MQRYRDLSILASIHAAADCSVLRDEHTPVPEESTTHTKDWRSLQGSGEQASRLIFLPPRVDGERRREISLTYFKSPYEVANNRMRRLQHATLTVNFPNESSKE